MCFLANVVQSSIFIETQHNHCDIKVVNTNYYFSYFVAQRSHEENCILESFASKNSFLPL